jgi:hypothetical protein
MKAYFACAFVIAVFFVSSGVYAEVVVDSAVDAEDTYGGGSVSGDGWGHSASAFADAYESFSTAYGSGHGSCITTEAGYFSWSCDGYADGSVSINLAPPAGSAWAAAGGSAGISAPNGSDGVAASASLSQSGDSGSYSGSDEPPSISISGYDYLSAFSGVGASHDAAAAAGVAGGGSADGFGSGSATCSMG